MSKKIIAALFAALIAASMLAACTGGESSSSSKTESTSSASSDASSSKDESSSQSESSSGAESSSSGTESSSSSQSSSSSSSAASSSSSKTESKPSTKPASKKDLYKEKEESFTLADGVYRRVYGNRAIFVVTTDPTTMSDSDMAKKAEEVAGTFYNNEYYCTVAFVKPDSEDGAFDMTAVKTDERSAVVYDLHRPDSESLTINLKEKPLQEYIDKQIKKATVKD